jgi:3-oxoadipate enol-lactonase
VKINGAELAVDVSGSGAPIVLVHAGVADRRMWGPLIAQLPADRQVIAYDMRGFGESELPDEPFSQARDLIGLLDALELARTTLVGASYGGRVALEVASNWPDRITGLALLSSATIGHEWSQGFRDYDAAEEAALEAGDIDLAVELNVRQWVDGPRRPSEVDPSVRALVADMQRRAFEIQLAVDPEEQPVGIDPAKISAPTLVAVGELDISDFHEIARDLAQAIPDVIAHEAIEGTTHLPALERPAEVAALLARLP